MTSEHDRIVMLEVKQNIDALDPDAILEWANDKSLRLTSNGRYSRLGEAFVLTMLRLEEVSASNTATHDKLVKIKSDIGLEMETTRMINSIHQIAREKVRRTWPHA